jgi:hypothetical protein
VRAISDKIRTIMKGERADSSPQRPVVTSHESEDGTRCVDIIDLRDGRFTFKECRRDVEDGGRWTLVADFSAHTYPSYADALSAARRVVSWLGS